MKKYILLLFSLFLLQISLIKSQNTLPLTATIYDQSPPRNPDFELNPYHNGVVEGIVLPNLGADGTPVYCCGQNPVVVNGRLVVNSETTFYSWFHQQDGVSLPIPYTLVLTETSPSVYEYQNNAFFPIDGEGWDNSTLYDDPHYLNHNFHFCMKIHYYFQYRGGEFFTFTGDDDVWVFFDDILRIDIGGIHTAASKTVYMDDLGFTVGNEYPFDFFYCERHTSQSTLNIFTNLNFTCLYYDACGICEGLNDTCCVVNQCDTINQCLDHFCGESTNFTCEYYDKSCADGNLCTSDYCDVGFGCINLPINCLDYNPCTIDSCNPGTGCINTPIENCEPCDDTHPCITTDPCFPQRCDPADPGQCITKAINCTNEDPCVNSYCVGGECVYEIVCTQTPTYTPSPSPTQTVTPTAVPTDSPFPTGTPTPPPEPPLPPNPPPPGLRPGCLTCDDLACGQQKKNDLGQTASCTYYINEEYEEGCAECCKYSPTCYFNDRL